MASLCNRLLEKRLSRTIELVNISLVSSRTGLKGEYFAAPRKLAWVAQLEVSLLLVAPFPASESSKRWCHLQRQTRAAIRSHVDSCL